MVGKILGFVVGSVLFGIGATVAEYGIKKVEKKFFESMEKDKGEKRNTFTVPTPTN
jgi:hypothetical protein